MPSWLITGLEIIGFAIAILIIYNLFKVYLMPKIKINKWVVLALGLIIFVFGTFLQVYIPWSLWRYVPSGLFVIMLLWFMDLSGIGGKGYVNKTKKPEIIMKPKAKPNRVKNNK